MRCWHGSVDTRLLVLRLVLTTATPCFFVVVVVVFFFSSVL